MFKDHNLKKFPPLFRFLKQHSKEGIKYVKFSSVDKYSTSNGELKPFYKKISKTIKWEEFNDKL